jgi:hypothetical protein
MGGPGSTRWAGHEKAKLVEESLSLDIRWLVREGVIRPHSYHSSAVRWGEREALHLSVEVGTREGMAYLRYKTPGRQGYQNIEESIRLVTTPDGRQWRWLCPARKAKEPCHRRVAILYLPPGAQRFACRTCHALTYKKSQESRRLRFEERVRRRFAEKLLCFADTIRNDQDLRRLLEGVQMLDADTILGQSKRRPEARVVGRSRRRRSDRATLAG